MRAPLGLQCLGCPRNGKPVRLHHGESTIHLPLRHDVASGRTRADDVGRRCGKTGKPGDRPVALVPSALCGWRMQWTVCGVADGGKSALARASLGDGGRAGVVIGGQAVTSGA